jgi:hypothetical protein
MGKAAEGRGARISHSYLYIGVSGKGQIGQESIALRFLKHSSRKDASEERRFHHSCNFLRGFFFSLFIAVHCLAAEDTNTDKQAVQSQTFTLRKSFIHHCARKCSSIFIFELVLMFTTRRLELDSDSKLFMVF